MSFNISAIYRRINEQNFKWNMNEVFLSYDLQQDNKRQMGQVMCNVLTAKSDVVREL